MEELISWLRNKWANHLRKKTNYRVLFVKWKLIRGCFLVWKAETIGLKFGMRKVFGEVRMRIKLRNVDSLFQILVCMRRQKQDLAVKFFHLD
jgi:hypothetical protein